jgi:hypothetical protein
MEPAKDHPELDIGSIPVAEHQIQPLTDLAVDAIGRRIEVGVAQLVVRLSLAIVVIDEIGRGSRSRADP